MTKHNLKIAPEYFEAVISGKKTFEIRKNDRSFKVGDTVALREYESDAQVPFEAMKYTGRTYIAKIGYITDFMQNDGYVVFSLESI